MLATVATNTERYRAARDQILAIADGTADTFSWPQLTGDFNWATDWFDVIARGNDRTALRIVEEDGSEQRISFAAMAERSDRVAAWLEQLGVGKGERVVLMLGNQVELWESTLAIAKLGAVVMPATSALGRSECADRITRARARVVITNAADAAKFDVDGDYRRVVVGADTPGWHPMSSLPGRSLRGPPLTIRC
jgi:acetyl-CoA synthetase